jgi:hypothetical protein
LLRMAVHVDMTESEISFGLKYVGTGPLVCPDGRSPRIVTVWMLRESQPPPYLVTAYPA